MTTFSGPTGLHKLLKVNPRRVRDRHGFVWTRVGDSQTWERTTVPNKDGTRFSLHAGELLWNHQPLTEVNYKLKTRPTTLRKLKRRTNR